MKYRVSFFIAAVAFVLGGCATPQTPIALTSEALTPQVGKIGVAMAQIPKTDTFFPGAGCLLCIATAAAANSALTAHIQTLPHEGLPELKNEVAALIDKKGVQTLVIEEAIDLAALPSFGDKGPGIALKDFTPFRERHGIDKLVVIHITGLGVIRTYSSYFPTSDPKGALSGIGYMVDLSNNRYEWYHPVFVTKSAEGAWNEPPQFPGVTNAYFQALEAGKDEFMKPFNSD